MNVGDIIEVEILSNGMDGEGVARLDGKVVFIPYTVKGERVKATVKRVKKQYAFATVIKILVPSEYRIEPTCPHYYKCGGCDMGHISPEYRKTVLTDELCSNLKKIANLDVTPSAFISSSGKTPPRNKLSMPFGIRDGKTVLGFYRQNTHVVEPVVCGMSDPALVELCKTVCDFADEKKLSVYDERTGKGLLRHVVMRTVAGRTSLTVVINADKLDGEKRLAERLPDNVDFFVSPNKKQGNVVMGDGVRLVKGNDRIAVDVLGVKAELSPLSFFQVNDEIRDELYKAAIAHLSSSVLIDLYSGIGITSNLAAKTNGRRNVYAVECVKQAVADADKTAALNGNTNVIRNICGDVEKMLPRIALELLSDQKRDVDILIDPPRKGCGAEVAHAVALFKPKNLVYVSCNHATMCRDVRAFLDVVPDYEVADCKIFDMFPNTHHTETLLCLRRKT